MCPESGGELAGESPVSVVAKQRCSWWPAIGETRSPKRHDKVPLGSEQAAGPQHEANLAASIPPPACQGKNGSRAQATGAKAMDGAKSLDVQHPGTRRRMEGGTVV